MNNTITVEGFVFEISTEINKSGVKIGLALKSISEELKKYLLETLPFKKEALKYTRHNKKRELLIKWLDNAEKLLALD